MNGKEYYFLSPLEFRQRIANNEFIEYEEVYRDCFYGTLKSEVDRISRLDKDIVFDVDVVGGVNIKAMYETQALSIFIQPPSVRTGKEASRTAPMRWKQLPNVWQRQNTRLTYASKFDVVLVNDDLETCKKEAERVVGQFLNQQ